MKKAYILILSVLCIFSLFSVAAAYDSPFASQKDTASNAQSFKSIKDGLIVSGKTAEPDQKSVFPSVNTAADSNKLQENDSRTEGYLVIDSITPLIEADEQALSMFSAFSGLRLDYATQTGSIPMTSFGLSLSDYPVFSYALQRTNPYFISSNFLGENTYMINEDDKFEEKLVDAVYRMVEKSNTGAEMPDINEVYDIIQSIRDGSMNVSPVAMQQSFEFTQEIDPSAFESVMMNLMMRFTEAAPEAENNYFFTDIPQDRILFSWPEVSTLPVFQKGSAAISGTITQQDILDILNALTQFLADNPEFADAVNQMVLTAMAQTNPQMAQMEGVNILNEILPGLKESAETNLKDFTLTFKMDQDMYGAPVLFIVEVVSRSETETTDTIIRFHMANDLNGAAFEAAVDRVQGAQMLPVIRALVSTSADKEGGSNVNINFLIDDGEKTSFEYSQLTETSSIADAAEISNTEINFDLNGERGYGMVFTTGTPNIFGGKDQATQITYTHISQGTPLITASISGESITTEALPGFTAADAVAVSQMNESDYDALVTNFFTNIMMLAMIFG